MQTIKIDEWSPTTQKCLKKYRRADAYTRWKFHWWWKWILCMIFLCPFIDNVHRCVTASREYTNLRSFVCQSTVKAVSKKRDKKIITLPVECRAFLICNLPPAQVCPIIKLVEQFACRRYIQIHLQKSIFMLFGCYIPVQYHF